MGYKNSTFLRHSFVDHVAKRAGANENESGITTLRLRSGYSLPVHRCLFKVYLLYLLYMKLCILPIYSRGNIYGPFAYPRLDRARIYLIYQRL